MYENTRNFQKLTPAKCQNPKFQIYFDALDYVFEDSEIRNIAISGAYCAGKSSVLETYKIQNSKRSFIHISLAHFTHSSESTSMIDGKSENKRDETSLEGKIINQLIHQINPNFIPQTLFKVKRQSSTKSIIYNTILVILCITSFAYFCGFNKLVELVNKLPDIGRTILNSSVLLFVLFIITILTYKIINKQSFKYFFKRLKLQGNEIEIFENDKEPYFDKYLNEVLYIFKNSAVDAIVFEDIDRFNNPNVFEKLREINYLINNNNYDIKKKNVKKVIRFFYLQRDDIFESKDRSKFFDFILPVVPVVDSSNSFDKFVELFNGNIIFERRFLRQLLLYVDDMRILKNIYNEYIVYYNIIKTTEPDQNKLLAIVTYKNIFPEDFANLQLCKGYVYNFLQKKNSVMEYKYNELNNEKSKLQIEIDEIEKESLRNIDELNALFFRTGNTILYLNNQTEKQYNTRTEFFAGMRENPENIYAVLNGSQINFNYNNEIEKLNNNNDYKRRLKIINSKRNNKQGVIEGKIKEINRKISSIENLKIAQLINDNFDENYIQTLFTETSFKNIVSNHYFPLIKFLLMEGYIDETFFDYITYFYPNSITENDKIFVRRVIDQTTVDYTHPLKNINLIIEYLNIKDFNKEQILNFNLLTFLVENNHELLESYISNLKLNNRSEFIQQYISLDKAKLLFIKALNHFWPEFLYMIIYEKEIFSDKEISDYVLSTIYASNEDDILKINIEECLKTYLNNEKDYMKTNNPETEKFISVFQLLDIRLKIIDDYSIDDALFIDIYQNGCFELTYSNIAHVLVRLFGLRSIKTKHSNFSIIKSLPDDTLYKNVKSNISEYFENMLEFCESKIEDTQESALELINNGVILNDSKEKYIEYLHTKIDKIINAEDKSIWKILIGLNKVGYNINNIIEYALYCGEIDEVLIEFINLGTESLNINVDEIIETYGEDNSGIFLDMLIQCNGIQNEKYRSILTQIDWTYEIFDLEGIESDKVLILISLDIIDMNETNLGFFREYYNETLINYITHKIDDYISVVQKEEQFIFDEIIIVLNESISDNYKISLLKMTEEAITIFNESYSDELKIYILNNNLDLSDLPKLVSSFITLVDPIKVEVVRLCIEHIDNILLNSNNIIPHDLIMQMLGTEKLKRELKIQIIGDNIQRFTKAEAKACFLVANMPEYLSIFNGKRPRMRITETSEKILGVLEKNGWASIKREGNYFQVYGRRKGNKRQEISIELL